MDPDRFDALSRALLSRRRALAGSALFSLLSRAVTDIGVDAAEVQAESCLPNGPICGRKRRGKKRRRRKRRRPCRKCCSGCTAGTRIKKRRCACCPKGARCSRGDQCCSGACLGGRCEGFLAVPETCTTPTTPSCNANPHTCGAIDGNCICLTTTSGSNGCFADQFVCFPNKTTCNDDADCIGLFGAGFRCVSTSGCQNNCGGNGNVCYPPCDA